MPCSWIMVVAGFFETILFLVFDICWRSMIADLAERTELETGRRNEGVISSTITFVTKCADGLGTFDRRHSAVVDRVPH